MIWAISVRLTRNWCFLCALCTKEWASLSLFLLSHVYAFVGAPCKIYMRLIAHSTLGLSSSWFDLLWFPLTFKNSSKGAPAWCNCLSMGLIIGWLLVQFLVVLQPPVARSPRQYNWPPLPALPGDEKVPRCELAWPTELAISVPLPVCCAIQLQWSYIQLQWGCGRASRDCWPSAFPSCWYRMEGGGRASELIGGVSLH